MEIEIFYLYLALINCYYTFTSINYYFDLTLNKCQFSSTLKFYFYFEFLQNYFIKKKIIEVI